MAARSTDVIFHNETDQPLIKVEDGLDHGEWTNPWQPKDFIAAEATSEWRSESDGIATGTEGHIRYHMGLVAKPGSPVAAVSRNPNQLDLFVVGNDGRVYTSWWTQGADWSSVQGNWRPIGGFFPVGAHISAVARTPNNLDLFVVGNDGRVYTSWWSQGSDWSGIHDNWRGIGGFFPVGAPISAVARTANNLDLFVTGNNGVVYTSWWYAGVDWSGIHDNWRSIGGFFPAGAPISAVARTPNNLDLFITGNDGRVYTSWWYAGVDWSGIQNNWRGIGGFFPAGAPISAVARTANNLDLFVTGNNGVVYTSWWYAGVDWSGIQNNWRSIGGFFPVGAPVNAVSRTPNNLDLFIVGNDGRVYTSWWSLGNDWSGIQNNWRGIGGFFPAHAPVSVVSRNPNQLDLFITGNDGMAYTSWWTQGVDWSGIHDNWRDISSMKSVYFHWDNPFSGQNKYHLSTDPGFQAYRTSGTGNNTTVEVFLRPAVRHDARGFLPSIHGYKFPNSWGDVPYSLPPLRGSILDNKYGTAQNGLCGGMVYSDRDFFEANQAIPATTTPPVGEQDPLFIYIVNRLFDSFDVDDISLYLKYMSPLYPDTDENVASTFGLADGRASVVINTEWPLIRADIDAGHPSPLGLVTVKSTLPWDLGKNHQVMAYAYFESGSDVTIWVYDPNQPLNDNVTIQFSTQAWDVPLHITHNVAITDDNGGRRPIYCLFRTNYQQKQPTAR